MTSRKLEGWFASPNPHANASGGAGAFVAADPDGVAVARFAWVDADAHSVSNERGAQTRLFGFVLAQQGGWRSVYVSVGTRWIRPGLPVTLMTRGEFWCAFRGGANVGDVVYASVIDGLPYSGQHDDTQATLYRVTTPAPPGGLAIISTWSHRP